MWILLQFSFAQILEKLNVWGRCCSITISLECLLQCEDVSVEFSLEASKVSWRWHVLRYTTNKVVGVICKCGEYKLCSVSVKNGNCMSLCIVVFLTYHAASNASTCILCIIIIISKIFMFEIVPRP
jgi:hypothetical protein